MCKIRIGNIEDAKITRCILQNAAQWLLENDMKLWPPEMFTESYVKNSIKNNTLVIAENESEPVGIMFLHESDDEFWPDKINDPAYYIHKLCVRRPYAKKGISSALIKWAYQHALHEGKKFLRLDCAPRPSLMNIYLQSGFVEIDRIIIPETKSGTDGKTIPGFITVRLEKYVS